MLMQLCLKPAKLGISDATMFSPHIYQRNGAESDEEVGDEVVVDGAELSDDNEYQVPVDGSDSD
jgi:hypothetical protein